MHRCTPDPAAPAARRAAGASLNTLPCPTPTLFNGQGSGDHTPVRPQTSGTHARSSAQCGCLGHQRAWSDSLDLCSETMFQAERFHAGGVFWTCSWPDPTGRACADVTVGSWMLAFNVTHFDDRRLCEPACSATSIAVYAPTRNPLLLHRRLFAHGADPKHLVAALCLPVYCPEASCKLSCRGLSTLLPCP